MGIPGPAAHSRCLASYSDYTRGRYTDLWLLLGDNAYDNGTDQQYQRGIFRDVAGPFTPDSTVWPIIGNHDVDPTYFNILSLPRKSDAALYCRSNVSDGTYQADYGYLANSPLVSQITFRSNSAVRMTTTKKYDFLNRLTSIASQPSASGERPISFSYDYNDANQRVRRADADTSYWSYGYDSLGQVTSGKHYWEDGTPIAGQQFEYAYDDIGNRRQMREGGDAAGTGLRNANYTVNTLNQYTQRDVPGAVNIIGAAHPNASTTVNGQSTYRRSEYYHNELSIDNGSAVVWQPLTNRAIYGGQTNTEIGNLLIPKTPQSFWYDLDGNMLSDFVWTNSWDGENRLAATENTTAVPTSARTKETWTFDDQGRWTQRIVHSWNGSAYSPLYTNRFLWDDDTVIGIFDHRNCTVTSFLRSPDLGGSLPNCKIITGGIGRMVALNSVSNGTHFCFYDANGNVMGLIGAADGILSGTYDFEPSGRLLHIAGSAARSNPIRFSTQFSDEFQGTIKYMYRDHQPTLGRWLSRDILGERGGVHEYAYVYNDTLNRVDALGLLTILNLVYETRIEPSKITYLGRTFNGGVKTRHSVDVYISDKRVRQVEKYIGPTIEYDSSGNVIGTGQASGSTVTVSSSTGEMGPSGGDLLMVVVMSGNEGNPLVSGAPGITYVVGVYIEVCTAERRYEYWGSHDQFPSHTFAIDGNQVHSFSHVAAGTTPASLFPPAPNIEFSGSGTY